MKLASVSDALIYAAVILFLEPFYVAAGFGLYLNRRTLLEGWDIEVALRRIAERHAAALLSILFAGLVLLCPCFSGSCTGAAEKPEGGDRRSAEGARVRPLPRHDALGTARPGEAADPKTPDLTFWHAIGYALAKAAEVALWVAATAALGYALWWLARRLPRGGDAQREAYQPPPALFGMQLAPDTLPADVAEAAARLAAAGQLRDALSLLYRGALSELVHKRGVQLLASHTEGEAVRSRQDARTSQRWSTHGVAAPTRGAFRPTMKLNSWRSNTGKPSREDLAAALRAARARWPRASHGSCRLTSACPARVGGAVGPGAPQRVSRRRALRHAHGPRHARAALAARSRHPQGEERAAAAEPPPGTRAAPPARDHGLGRAPAAIWSSKPSSSASPIRCSICSAWSACAAPRPRSRFRSSSRTEGSSRFRFSAP